MDGQNPFRATLKPLLKPLFVGIYRGMIIPVFFLGGAGFCPSPAGEGISAVASQK